MPKTIEDLKKLISEAEQDKANKDYNKILRRAAESDVGIVFISEENQNDFNIKKARRIKILKEDEVANNQDLKQHYKTYFKIVENALEAKQKATEAAAYVAADVNGIGRADIERKELLLMNLLREKEVSEIWSNNQLSYSDALKEERRISISTEDLKKEESETYEHGKKLTVLKKYQIDLGEDVKITFNAEIISMGNQDSGIFSIDVDFRQENVPERQGGIPAINLWRINGQGFTSTTAQERKIELFQKIEEQIEALSKRNQEFRVQKITNEQKFFDSIVDKTSEVIGTSKLLSRKVLRKYKCVKKDGEEDIYVIGREDKKGIREDKVSYEIDFSGKSDEQKGILIRRISPSGNTYEISETGILDHGMTEFDQILDILKKKPAEMRVVTAEEELTEMLNGWFKDGANFVWLGSKDSLDNTSTFIENCSMEKDEYQWNEGTVIKKGERDVFTFKLSNNESLNLLRDEQGVFLIKYGSEAGGKNRYELCEKGDFIYLKNLLSKTVERPLLFTAKKELKEIGRKVSEWFVDDYVDSVFFPHSLEKNLNLKVKLTKEVSGKFTTSVTGKGIKTLELQFDLSNDGKNSIENLQINSSGVLRDLSDREFEFIKEIFAAAQTPYLATTQEKFAEEIGLSGEYERFFADDKILPEVEYRNADGEAFIKRVAESGKLKSIERYKLNANGVKENSVTYSFDYLGRLLTDDSDANSVVTRGVIEDDLQYFSDFDSLIPKTELELSKDLIEKLEHKKVKTVTLQGRMVGGSPNLLPITAYEINGKYIEVVTGERGKVSVFNIANNTRTKLTIAQIYEAIGDVDRILEIQAKNSTIPAQKSGQGSTTSGQSEFGLSQKDFETFSELGITVSFESKPGETKVSYQCSKESGKNTYSLVQEFHRPDSNHPKFIVDFNYDPTKPKITRKPREGLFASKPDRQFQEITRAFSQKLRSPIFDDDEEMYAVIEKFESLFGDQNPWEALIIADPNWLESKIWQGEQDGNYYFLSSEEKCVRLNLNEKKLEVFYEHDDYGNLIFRECDSRDAEIIYDFKVTIARAEKIRDIYQNDFDDTSSEADSVSSDNSSSNGSDGAYSESSESYDYDVQSSNNQKPSQFDPQVTKQIHYSITTDEVAVKLFGENLKKQKQDIGRRKAFESAAEEENSIKAIDLLIDSVSQDEIFDNKLKRALVKVDSDLKKSQVRTLEDTINLWMNDLSSLDKKVLISAYNSKNPTSKISEGLADKRNIKTRITTSKSNTKKGIKKNILEDAVLAKLDVKTSLELKEAKKISTEDENDIINVLVSATQLLHNWKQDKQNIPQEFEAFKKQQADQIYGRPGTSISVINVQRFVDQKAAQQPRS